MSENNDLSIIYKQKAILLNDCLLIFASMAKNKNNMRS